ncbi:uncharacterized protein LOC109601227 isoform X2 [Aethina tumida]|nr:uncharacterized protein LOC109601227 isoform X2 [Aethina tumida]
MFGSILVTTSLLATRYCTTFYQYVVCYSMCYGSGIGITQAANCLALNTYFKKKRRIATGLSWTTTGLGPIFWPHIITYFNSLYGMEGTLMIFAGLALHAFVCALLLHPVEWHTKYREEPEPEAAKLLEQSNNPPKLLRSESKSRSVFSSQILYEDHDPVYQGCDINDVGTPNILKGNEWYKQTKSQVGSRVSLSSNKIQSKVSSGQNSTLPSKRPSYNNLFDARPKKNPSASLVSEGKPKRERKHSFNKAAITEEVEDVPDKTVKDNNHLQVYPNERDVLKTAAKKLEEYQQNEDKKLTENKEGEDQKLTHEEPKKDEPKKKQTLWEKIVDVFDFALLKDPIFLNLMLGIIIANFAELNFSILTPNVLSEFHFLPYQIAMFMSLLGALDLLIRFFAPFAAEKLDWDNKVFFLIGVAAMALGRIILVHTQTYSVGLFVAGLIGAGKGLRTVFMALIVPQYVPIQRLPAATGLHLATSGLFFIFVGPVVGWVQDQVRDYVITLHLLNLCTYVVAVSWMIEAIITKLREKKKSITVEP